MMAEPATQTEPDGWTGGQFSLLRGLLGLWLAGRSIAWLVPGDGAVAVLATLALLLSLALIIGWRPRWIGLALAAVNLAMAVTAGLTPGPTLATLASILEPAAAIALPLAIAWAPPAPFGSWHAIGRTDPVGDWRMPPAWTGTLTAALAVADLLGAIYLLTDPAWQIGTGLWQPGVATGAAIPLGQRLMTWAILAAWLAFAGIALVSHLRPWIWLMALALTVLALAPAGWWGLALAWAAWHAACLDPAWLAPKTTDRPERLFYDGHCGLCHRSVRLVVAEDTHRQFIASPLQSRAFEQAIPADKRQTLPNSIVVQRSDRRLLARSRAVFHILDRLGGWWRIVSWLGRAVPTPLADAGYRAVAAIRNRLFARPSDVCPMIPPDMRDRFEM